MKNIHDWLDEYGESHQNAINKLIHWICVPLIVWSIIGLLWSIPNVDFLRNSGLNWALVAITLSVGYYFFLSPALGVSMLIFLYGSSYLISYVEQSSELYPLWGISLVVFVVAWIGQFYGHKVEGKKPSFLKDVQFLLIGPMWLMSAVYRKLGIKY
ncbi:MAG: DUF962 domain-containing protein [Flavobacteriales bacterium]